MPDKYTRVARIYPAIICLVPLQILFASAAGSPLSNLLNNVLGATIAVNLGVGTVLLFLMMHINRFIGKEIEKVIFDDEMSMPTTELLMPSSSALSLELRSLVEQKLEQEFRFSLPSLEEEQNNELNTRRRIVDAVALMRRSVGSGTLLLQHNIEYGFVRNLIGGSPISFVAAVTGAVYCYSSGNTPIAMLMVGCAAFFLITFALSKLIVHRFGELYAKRLIQEFV